MWWEGDHLAGGLEDIGRVGQQQQVPSERSIQ
jgi:hypothetical protein